MTIALEAGRILTEVGSVDFTKAFFYTISANLEPKGWGSRFPIIMNKLYNDGIPASLAADALKEAMEIREELKKLPVSKLVWDITDRSKQPPWGDDISEDITDLSNYFVTSTGRDLMKEVIDQIDDQRESGKDLKLVSY
ncbi:hypothetical protein FGG78_28580 [Thioclava sp. BHET1]|nr:hypothetical protein FGG78_28580 [Thioclava sp. BHET1]